MYLFKWFSLSFLFVFTYICIYFFLNFPFDLSFHKKRIKYTLNDVVSHEEGEAARKDDLKKEEEERCFL